MGLNILDFIESKSSFAEEGELFPVQKFLLKLIYGLPLDSEIKQIRITDKFNEKVLDILTEEDYFNFLRKEGRINLLEPPKVPIQEAVLCVGRRSGKSILSKELVKYNLYNVINSFLRLKDTPEISKSINLSVLVINKPYLEDFRSNAKEIFQGFLKNEGLSIKEETGKFGSVLKVSFLQNTLEFYIKTALHKTTKGVLNNFILFDELDYFTYVDDTPSDKDFYLAEILQPEPFSESTSRYPEDKGNIISISSPHPNREKGQFYKLYDYGMKQKVENYLVVRIPSWELNPNLAFEYLKQRYNLLGEERCNIEYGAEFRK